MEIRRKWYLPLESINDEIFKVSYLKLLGYDKFEKVKLPTSLVNYKYNYLMTPTNLLYLELVKTKKNWIIKSVIEHKILIKIEKYENYAKLGEIKNLILKYFNENNDIAILSNIITAVTNIESCNLQNLEQEILKSMGFI